MQDDAALDKAIAEVKAVKKFDVRLCAKNNPKEIKIICNKFVNDKNERQSNVYDIYEDKIQFARTTDFAYALQCFINRL